MKVPHSYWKPMWVFLMVSGLLLSYHKNNPYFLSLPNAKNQRTSWRTQHSLLLEHCLYIKISEATFNEAALLAELSAVIKFVCTAFRSVVSETAETTVWPEVLWQPIVIRALKVCCTSTANRLSGHTPCHTLTPRECLGMCALGLFLRVCCPYVQWNCFCGQSRQTQWIY